MKCPNDGGKNTFKEPVFYICEVCGDVIYDFNASWKKNFSIPGER